jgi:hypothetical protein
MIDPDSWILGWRPRILVGVVIAALLAIAVPTGIMVPGPDRQELPVRWMPMRQLTPF